MDLVDRTSEVVRKGSPVSRALLQVTMRGRSTSELHVSTHEVEVAERSEAKRSEVNPETQQSTFRL